MTRTLILMRHAKSSWDMPDLEDHQRPLNNRGVKSASALGRWLQGGRWSPDQVLSSSSRRTRETFAGLGVQTLPEFTDALYHASASRMRAELMRASGGVVLMLGHNPGIGEFATRLVGVAPVHARFFDYPTGATLIAEFDISDWAQVGWGAGRAIEFVVPRELMT